MKALMICLTVLLMTGLAFGQWVATTPMNDSRHGLDAVEHNGNIYVVGGWDGSTTLERFTAGTWTTLPSLPIGQAGVCVALVGDEIYTFGGYGPLDTVQIFNIYTNSWSTCPSDLPQALYWATAEAVGDLVYVIGGYYPGVALNTVYILDTTTNVWTTGMPCPVTMQTCTSVVYGDYIYVFGRNGDFKYDYANDSWSSMAYRPYLTGGASAEVIDDAIYVTGGNYGYIYFAEPYTQIYDTASNWWSLGPDLILPRYQLTSGYVDDYLYSIGGRDANAGSQDWVERLHLPDSLEDIEIDLWTQTPTIPAAGGTLFYGANVTNNTANILYRDAWTMVHTPTAYFYGPMLNIPVTLPPGTVSANNLTQNVPGFAPAGNYTFHAYIGFYGPWTVHATDSFIFTKLTVAAGDNVDDWSASEWDLVASEDESNVSLPTEYAMESAYPNPFNPTTTISVSLPVAANLTVRAFNVNGQVVGELANGQFSAGNHTLTFDASNLASGLYFIEAHVPGHLNATQKVMLVR